MLLSSLKVCRLPILLLCTANSLKPDLCRAQHRLNSALARLSNVILILLVTSAGQYFRGYDQYIRPIHMAAYEARPDLMRLLLTSGASVDAPDRKGRTPIQCVLAPTFFDDKSLVGKPSKTTARQRLTLQVLNSRLQQPSVIPFPGHLHRMLECTKAKHFFGTEGHCHDKSWWHHHNVHCCHGQHGHYQKAV